MTTRIILVRHGQTEWNRVERFRGRVEIELNETGRKQARLAADRLAAMGLAAIYSSPLRRAVDTASPTAEAAGMPVMEAPEISDVDYGAWQGLTVAEAGERYPEVFSTWRQAPEAVRFPGGEGMQDVYDRASRFVDSLQAKHAGQAVALVSHIVVCRMLITHFLGIGPGRFWKFGLGHCSLSIFEVRDDGLPIATAINDVCHLREAGCESA